MHVKVDFQLGEVRISNFVPTYTGPVPVTPFMMVFVVSDGVGSSRFVESMIHDLGGRDSRTLTLYHGDKAPAHI